MRKPSAHDCLEDISMSLDALVELGALTSREANTLFASIKLTASTTEADRVQKHDPTR